MANPENKVKLYGMFASPYSRMVEIALRMKGVEYEYFDEDIFTSKSEDLLKYNPVHKKVPVLVHNGKSIAESMVIIEYIDETWKSGPAILPVDPYERAMARFWAAFITTKCMPSFWVANWISDEAKSKKRGEEACENIRILEKQLGNKKFFGGESVGFLDIPALFFSHWVEPAQEVTGREVVKDNDFPLLSKWKEEILAWNVAQETIPSKNELSAFLKEKAPFLIARVSS